MFALLALSSSVCKKAARPICENIQPMATMANRAGDVFLKKLVESTKLPSKKNIKFVTKAKMKLKRA